MFVIGNDLFREETKMYYVNINKRILCNLSKAKENKRKNNFFPIIISMKYWMYSNSQKYFNLVQ